MQASQHHLLFLLSLSSCSQTEWFPYLHFVSPTEPLSWGIYRSILCKMHTRNSPVGKTRLWFCWHIPESQCCNLFSRAMAGLTPSSAVESLCLTLWGIWTWPAKLGQHTRECESVEIVPEPNANLRNFPPCPYFLCTSHFIRRELTS